MALPSDLTYGYALGSWIEAWGDGADADRLPDRRAAVGTVKITPDRDFITSTAEGKVLTGIYPKPINCTIGADGLLRDEAGGVGVFLITGTYQVVVDVTGAPLRKGAITVTTAHTDEKPLDIVASMPLAPAPTERFVLSEQTLIDAQAAVVQAQAAAVRAEAAAGGGGGAVSSVSGRIGAVVLTPTDVSLGRVNNTNDLEKPVSTATAAALAQRALATRRIVAGTGVTGTGDLTADVTLGLNAASVASLAKADSAVQPAALAAKADLVNGTVPIAQVPTHTHTAAQISDASTVGRAVVTAADAATARNALAAAAWGITVGAGTGMSGGGDLTANRTLSLSPATIASLAKADTALQSVTKASVGLPLVDNTADVDKPVSTATATALGGKAPTTHTHTASQISDSTTVGRALLTATDAATARAAIGAGTGSGSSSTTHPATVGSGTAVTIDTTQKTTQVYTLTGNATVAFGGTPAAGAGFQTILVLKQDATGSRTVTWPTTILWVGGNAPTLSIAASAVDKVQLEWDGVEWTGTTVGNAFVKAATAPVATTKTLYTQSTASTLSTFATEGNVTMSGGVLTLTPAATGWAGGVKAFLATTNNVAGNPATGTPTSVPDMTFTIDVELQDLAQQYPLLVLRTRSQTWPDSNGVQQIDDLWAGGNDIGMPKRGYYVQFSIAEGLLSLWDAATATQIGVNIPFTFPNRLMRVKGIISGKSLQLRVWAQSASEPTTWAINLPTALTGQFDGTIGFVQGNGQAPTSKPLKISNLVVTTPIITMKPAAQAPTTEPTGFTRIYTENFDTAATTGTGASSVLAKYGSTSLQFYNDEGVYWPRATTSVHDGVLDVNLDGTKGAAFVFGGTDIAYNRVGGRFAFRAMALDAIGNGTATMIWPSSRLQSDGTTRERWADGELDYPESNFEDTPMVHHHSMVEGSEINSINFNTNVSWRDWHEYAVVWYPPGKGPTPTTGSVTYYVDGAVVGSPVTQDVPSVAHRFMFQIGNYGQPGHFLVDWATMAALTS